MLRVAQCQSSDVVLVFTMHRLCNAKYTLRDRLFARALDLSSGFRAPFMCLHLELAICLAFLGFRSLLCRHGISINPLKTHLNFEPRAIPLPPGADASRLPRMAVWRGKDGTSWVRCGIPLTTC